MIRALPEYENARGGVLIDLSSNRVCTVSSDVAIELNLIIFYTQRHETHCTYNRMLYLNTVTTFANCRETEPFAIASRHRALNASPVKQSAFDFEP
jgi:hypothetical protein